MEGKMRDNVVYLNGRDGDVIFKSSALDGRLYWYKVRRCLRRGGEDYHSKLTVIFRVPRFQSPDYFFTRRSPDWNFKDYIFDFGKLKVGYGISAKAEFSDKEIDEFSWLFKLENLGVEVKQGIPLPITRLVRNEAIDHVVYVVIFFCGYPDSEAEYKEFLSAFADSQDALETVERLKSLLLSMEMEKEPLVAVYVRRVSSPLTEDELRRIYIPGAKVTGLRRFEFILDNFFSSKAMWGVKPTG